MNNKTELVPLNERKMEITKQITDYFIRKHVCFGMKTYERTYEDDGDDNPQIQFNFNVEGIPDLAIFYDVGESKWYMNSIYELLRPIIEENFNEIKKMFENDKGIFKDIMATDNDLECGEISEIHLYSQFDDDEFNEAKLDEIYDYMQNKTKFANYLAKLSKKR